MLKGQNIIAFEIYRNLKKFKYYDFLAFVKEDLNVRNSNSFGEFKYLWENLSSMPIDFY